MVGMTRLFSLMLRRTYRLLFAFLLVAALCITLWFFGVWGALVDAATGTVDPNADGTVGGTQTTCGGLGEYDCLNDAVRSPTAPTATGDYVTYANGAQSYYQMSTLTGVSSVSALSVPVYHVEQKSNMSMFISLWDSTETVQYGTEVQLTNRTTAQWDTAAFSGLALTQTQLDGLKVRIRCTRTGTAGASTCRSIAMYADVTYTQAIDVLVSTTGTQQNVTAGTNNAYLGGAFVVAEQTSSRSITSVTVAETGTIDALNNMKNIKLYYEQVASCAAATYDGTEAQFGSTLTGGFTGGTTATFTGSVTISTGTQLCLYVVADVLSSALPAATIELQITNPATDTVYSGTPVISPATAVAIAGTGVVQKTVPTQIHYHWRNDDGSETTATSATGGTEDTPWLNVGRGIVNRLRIEVSNEGNASTAATQYRLEYAQKVSTCSVATGWTDVGAVGGAWDMTLSSNIADGDTTNIATSTGGTTDENSTFVGTGALRETTSSSGSITLSSTEFTELEYAITATGLAIDGDTYCFRVTNAGTPITAYAVYPEVSITSDLLVTAEGTQVSAVSIPTTNQELGARFVVTDTTAGSHILSSFTLSATGTVDLAAGIDNVSLWYDSVTDCSTESFNGNETQFGTTATDGFAGGDAVFTDSLSISPTASACFYVVYDVTSTAEDGDTLDVYLTNASTDLVIDTGSIAPSATVQLAGTTTFVKPHVVQSHYHWRDNSGTEATALSATGGVEDTPWLEYPDGTVTRLRFGIANTGGEDATNYNFRLEWAPQVTTCEAATGWTDIDAAGDDWQTVASQLVQGSDTTDIGASLGGVTNVGAFTTVPGQVESTSTSATITIPAASYAELEYSLQALTTVTEGSRDCFRVTNNGVPLDAYSVYAAATVKLDTDYAVYRGVSDITGTSITLTEGVDYDLQFNDASRAFIRITNGSMTGGGPAAGSTGNHNSTDVTAYISNPGNIATSVNLTRSGTVNDTQVAWEVVEYIGDVGGENEFVVRSASTASYTTTGTTVTTGTVSGVVNDADVVVYITGQQNPDGSRLDYNTGISTSAWDAGTDTATFTRGEAGTDAGNISYAVVEFTGANWKVQRVEHTYSTVGVTETESLTPVNSVTRAFIHAQHRAGTDLDTHADFGHEVWLSSIGAVSFRLNGAASTPTGHVSVAWVVENTQLTGKRMNVTRIADAIPAGGGGLTSLNVDIGTTLDDLSVASISITNSTDGALRTFPEPMITAHLISTSQFNLQVSDDGDAHLYRVEVVEWPTASRKLIQDDFRIYEDNDALTPTTPRGGLGENAEMLPTTAPLAPSESVRIRMSLRVTAAAMPAGVDSFMLQYAKRPAASSCSAIGSWSYLGDVGSTTAAFAGVAATPVDGTALSSLLLSASTIAGSYEEQNPTALTPNQALVNDVVEYDWNVMPVTATDKSDYCFRMVEADGSALSDYETYPVLRTVGYGPVVSHWRFYDDETNFTPTVPLANEDQTPSGIDFDDLFKLRVSVAETSGANGTDAKFKLQFSRDPSFATSTDVVAIADCQANSLWCYADGAGVDNDPIDSAVISDTASCSGGVGAGCGTYNESTSTLTATVDHQAYATSEFEFTLKHAGARVNTVYYFRLWNIQDDEVVPASSTNPSVLSATSTINATSTSVTAGYTIDGFSSDVDTSPTLVPFGDVPFNSTYYAIQQLALSTNATEGYRVFAFMDQPLTNTYGGSIPSVLGTNAAPQSWASGCTSGMTACFGYHTSDDVLLGGSARFAPDDTFAAMTTTPAEIIYSAAPGTEVHDIVYALEVGDEQPAGDYTAAITYIITPVY